MEFALTKAKSIYGITLQFKESTYDKKVTYKLLEQKIQNGQ